MSNNSVADFLKSQFCHGFAVRDPISGNKFYDVDNLHYDCYMDYLKLLRFKVEKTFQNEINDMHTICELRKQPKHTTGKMFLIDLLIKTVPFWNLMRICILGKGWLLIRIEYVRFDGSYDFANGNSADTYVKIFVNNEEKHRTQTFWDTKYRVYDLGTFQSYRIDKTSSIRFEVYDEDTGFLRGADDLIMSWDTTIESLLVNCCSNDKDSVRILYIGWDTRKDKHTISIFLIQDSEPPDSIMCVKAFWLDEFADVYGGWPTNGILRKINGISVTEWTKMRAETIT